MDFKKLGENLMLEEEEFKELLALFVDTGTADTGRLESAAMTGDEKGIKSASHSLAGASGNLGITEIHNIAKDIEINFAQYSKTHLLALVTDIMAHITYIKSRL